MAQVFISYKHNDAEFAALMKLQLEDAGFEAWLDEDRLRAGEDWREGIDKAIKESLALVVIMTPEAKASEYVTYEWACAWGAGVPVIPIIRKPTKLHPRLEALQYLDFTNSRERQWDKLIQRLDELDKKYHPHTIHVPRDVPPSIKRAVEALDSHDSLERQKAIQSLVQTTHSAAIEALVQALHHPIRDVRKLVILELRDLEHEKIVPGLIDALNDIEADIRADVIWALASKKDHISVPGLLLSLDDTVDYVKTSAIDALGKIGDVRAIPKLREMLQDTNINIQKLSAEALTRIGTPDTLIAVEQWKSIQDSQSTGRIELRQAAEDED